jgi:exonuclease III
LIIV